jgi:hypothetical protein
VSTGNVLRDKTPSQCSFRWSNAARIWIGIIARCTGDRHPPPRDCSLRARLVTLAVASRQPSPLPSIVFAVTTTQTPHCLRHDVLSSDDDESFRAPKSGPSAFRSPTPSRCLHDNAYSLILLPTTSKSKSSLQKDAGGLRVMCCLERYLGIR